MPTILLVEDEIAIAQAVQYALRSEGFTVEHHLLGSEVVSRVARGGVDLVLLDVGLPDTSGFEVCRQLRQQSELPVVFLTARSEEIDRVLGLELGADDYLVKPFSPRELVARVRARLRRNLGGGRWRSIGDFSHDTDGRRIRYHGQPLDLTRYEQGLLEVLLARPGAVFSRAQLMDAVWSEAPETSDRTVDTHVKTLRAKLRAIHPKGEVAIRTHRGLGYALGDATP